MSAPLRKGRDMARGAIADFLNETYGRSGSTRGAVVIMAPVSLPSHPPPPPTAPLGPEAPTAQAGGESAL